MELSKKCSDWKDFSIGWWRDRDWILFVFVMKWSRFFSLLMFIDFFLAKFVSKYIFVVIHLHMNSILLTPLQSSTCLPLPLLPSQWFIYRTTPHQLHSKMNTHSFYKTRKISYSIEKWNLLQCSSYANNRPETRNGAWIFFLPCWWNPSYVICKTKLFEW